MSDTKDRLIRPPVEDSVFIGWEAQPPRVDRRFMLAAAVGLILAGGGAGAAVAAVQRGPGAGTWDQATVVQLTGLLVADPYPRLVGSTLGGSALLVCPVKCGPGPRAEDLTGQVVRITGTVLERGRHRMVAVNDDAEGLRAATSAEQEGFAVPARAGEEDLGAATLTGEVLDAKCWFGAMRPGDGKAHKACAALCIRYGVPPAFFSRDAAGRSHAFVLTDAQGAAHGHDLLPLVADPVRAEGRLVRLGDQVQFRADVTAFTRITGRYA